MLAVIPFKMHARVKVVQIPQRADALLYLLYSPE